MKRFLTVLMAAALVLTVMGCGGASGSETTDVDVSELADAMLDALAPAGEMTEMGEELAVSYYDMGEGLVSEYKIYMSGVYLAEEVALFRLSSPDKAEEGKSMLEKRIQDLKDNFDGYLPDQYDAMVNATILQQGDLVCFVVGGEPGLSDAKAVVEKAVK